MTFSSGIQGLRLAPGARCYSNSVFVSDCLRHDLAEAWEAAGGKADLTGEVITQEGKETTCTPISQTADTQSTASLPGGRAQTQKNL